jgi:hypothetical protein
MPANDLPWQEMQMSKSGAAIATAAALLFSVGSLIGTVSGTVRLLYLEPQAGEDE